VYAGHAAIATLVKGVRPRIAIAFLLPVAFAPDWIEWLFDLFGRHNREISHSLISVGVGATVVALVYLMITRARVDAMAVWLTYASHWPADYFTGLKPTWPGGPMVGLFLYRHPLRDAAVESLIVVACWFVYRRSLPREARGRALGLLVPAGLIAMHLAFVATSNPALRK
jgi:membrane-bound metal-dependent hydrolase YbcI (DUF457 family)